MNALGRWTLDIEHWKFCFYGGHKENMAMGPVPGIAFRDDGLMRRCFTSKPTHETNKKSDRGPVFAFPTATAKLLGTGKWLMGPDAAAVIALPPSWSFSMEIANLWSFAGDSHRMQINSFFARPSAGYAFLFAKKLYLFTAPAFEANWVSPADRWIVPVGGGIGFPFNIYKLAIDISTQLTTSHRDDFPKRHFSDRH